MSLCKYCPSDSLASLHVEDTNIISVIKSEQCLAKG
jgi:hypothetical protein